MSKQHNYFDEILPETKIDTKAQVEIAAKHQRLDYLIHQVFEQSPEGKELINIWKESLLMNPTAEDGMDMIAVGIREGQKRMIRGIVLTIQRVKGE